jgi:hypothetical protein
MLQKPSSPSSQKSSSRLETTASYFFGYYFGSQFKNYYQRYYQVSLSLFNNHSVIVNRSDQYTRETLGLRRTISKPNLGVFLCVSTVPVAITAYYESKKSKEPQKSGWRLY